MSKPAKNSPFQLLVEGPDDQFVVINLLRRNGHDFDGAKMPFVRAHGGVEDLLSNIGLTIKGGHRRIGVVLDADHPPYDRWAQLKVILSGTGLDLPARPVVGGMILPGPPRFGVWVMPDNGRAIELKAPLKELHLAKGAMHAWLSWQDPSGHPLGRALEYGTLRHDTPEALRFVNWFSGLFEVRPTREIES